MYKGLVFETFALLFASGMPCIIIRRFDKAEQSVLWYRLNAIGPSVPQSVRHHILEMYRKLLGRFR